MFGRIRETAATVTGQARSTFANEVCPFCFDTFKLKETPFRCASPPGRCKVLPDPVLKRAWGNGLPIGQVLASDGWFAQSRACPDCGQRSHKRLCPHCHQDLPHTFGEYRNFIFSVVGAKWAGKSHYLTVLIEQLKNHVGPRLDMLLQPVNDQTINRYRTQFHTPLFSGHRTLDATQSAFLAQEVQFPMVFTMMFSGKSLMGRDKIRNAVTISFFDTAGEDLKAEDNMSAVNKYIYRSDGIILLLDPLQLDYVRDTLGTSTPLPPRESETADIIARMTKLIRIGRSLGSTSPIPIPLAVTFSKLDAVVPLIDPQMQINSTSRLGTTFDRSDFEAVNAEVQSLIAQWESQYLLQQVTTQFKTYGFFGMSALGCQPDPKTRAVARITPQRVEDPFLWLLHHHKLIKAAA